ncbi:MAG: hypothetical protein JNK12_11215 [Acidimicrobiales bacterium]|nr:hypothetical protein [Acidimicrobiales bacterium]
MSLETWDAPSRLYLARGDEVSSRRPLFTGDVIDGVAIPGVQVDGSALVLAHPCAMRRGAKLADGILVAAVRPHDAIAAEKWSNGFFDRMPLPELRGPTLPFEAARLAEIGLAEQSTLNVEKRVACLSPVGVNILQQRNVFHMTRLEVPTARFWEAFGHTFEEADLLEEWTEELADVPSIGDPVQGFEDWIRAESRQERLTDPQQRASIRSEMRVELRAMQA